jgi:hypothetical protein
MIDCRFPLLSRVVEFRESFGRCEGPNLRARSRSAFRHPATLRTKQKDAQVCGRPRRRLGTLSCAAAEGALTSLSGNLG